MMTMSFQIDAIKKKDYIKTKWKFWSYKVHIIKIIH